MLRNGLEPWHLLILAIVVIMLFGSKKLPDSARALGQSLRILKSETKAMKEDGATAGPRPPNRSPLSPHNPPPATLPRSGLPARRAAPGPAERPHPRAHQGLAASKPYRSDPPRPCGSRR